MKLGLALTSVAVTLWLLEFALRLLGWAPLYISPERDRFWQYDALLGWAHRPGQAGVFETPQFRTLVRINQQGLRDREHAYRRPDGSHRILLLGDSFAWGYGVEEAERFSQQLETSLGVEVINAGVSGYSTDQELLWYRAEGTKYSPDLVILSLTGNDVADNAQTLVYTIYYKPRFILEAGQPVLTGQPVPRTSLGGRTVYALSQRSALVFFLTQQYFNLRTALASGQPAPLGAGARLAAPDAQPEPIALTVALLDEIRKTAAANGAALMIVATPRWWSNGAGGSYASFVSSLTAQGFLVLDVETLPGFDPASMLIPNDGHWNPAGHAFVAAQLEQVIAREQLLR